MIFQPGQASLKMFFCLVFLLHLVCCATSLERYTADYFKFLDLLDSGNPRLEELSSLFERGLKLPNSLWTSSCPTVEVLKLCLDHYEFKNEEEKQIMCYFLATKKADKFGVEPASTDLVVFALEHLNTFFEGLSTISKILHLSVRSGNSSIIAYILENYKIELDTDIRYSLFEKTSPLNHNEILKLLFKHSPKLGWEKQISEYMKCPNFKPETFEWLLENGLPKHSEHYTHSLMDHAIYARRPDLADLCIKLCIPPSKYMMLERSKCRYILSLNDYLEREYTFQKVLQFMIFAQGINDQFPQDIATEIIKNYIEANKEKLLLK